jgi:AraC-like DNA-binding protein
VAKSWLLNRLNGFPELEGSLILELVEKWSIACRIMNMRLNYFILFFLILLSPVFLSAQALPGQLKLFTPENYLQMERVCSVSNYVEAKTAIDKGHEMVSFAGLDINAILPEWNNMALILFYFVVLTALLYLFRLISTSKVNPDQFIGEEVGDKVNMLRNYGKKARFFFGISPKLSPQFTTKTSHFDDFDFKIPVPKEIYRNEKTDVQDSWNSRRTEYSQNFSFDKKDQMPEKFKKKETILIVDDHVDFRNYLCSKLKNYQVLSCSNGREAAKLAREYLPDLIISNVMVPGMDGFQLCDVIKNNNITSRIIVILLSEKQDHEEKLRGYKNKADAFVEIPFSMNLLLLQIDNLLKKRKMIRSKFASDSVETINYNVFLEMDRQFLDKVKEIVERKLMSNELSVETISHEIGMSRSQLYRKFKTLTDITPKEYITISRLEKSVELLSSLRYTVNEVAFRTGFYDGSHFGTVFKMQFGITPKQFVDQLSVAKKEMLLN